MKYIIIVILISSNLIAYVTNYSSGGITNSGSMSLTPYIIFILIIFIGEQVNQRIR